jgi:uncharacterized protein (DUF362 family)
MMGNIVSIVRASEQTKGINGSISKALNLIRFQLSKTIKSVVIKPNLCYYWDASTGYTTDPKIVSGIIDYLREKCGVDADIKVAEADASAMRTRHVFPILGYDRMAKEKDVELFNLSNDTLLDETVRVNGREISFKVPASLKKCDLFINVPKLKIMQDIKITCAMKNVFGCIGFPRKMIYHKFLNEAIVGINKVLHPDLTIVDGLVGLGRFPIRLGLIMASVDIFSADWVASQIMGYRPSAVRFLKLAAKEKVGDPNGVVVAGEDVKEFAKVFPKEGFVSSRYLWGIQFWLLNAYRKITGDTIPPMLEEA